MGDQGEKGVGSLQGAGEQRAASGIPKMAGSRKKIGKQKTYKEVGTTYKGTGTRGHACSKRSGMFRPPARDHPHIYL